MKGYKHHYEVALKQHVKGSVADDYESVAFINESSYRRAVQTAKKWSRLIGTNNKEFSEKDRLDAGLAQVVIICYYTDNFSDYNEVWQEEYINGKKTERYHF